MSKIISLDEERDKRRRNFRPGEETCEVWKSAGLLRWNPEDGESFIEPCEENLTEILRLLAEDGHIEANDIVRVGDIFKIIEEIRSNEVVYSTIEWNWDPRKKPEDPEE